MRRHLVPGLAAAVLLAAGPALAQHPDPHASHAAPPSGDTVNLQGGGQQAFMDSPHIHAFYDLSKKALGHGPVPEAEVAAYEQQSYAIFRALGPSMGMKPEQMQDHLKLIPRQVVQIVKEDPHTLDSYRNFTDALVGPP